MTIAIRYNAVTVIVLATRITQISDVKLTLQYCQEIQPGLVLSVQTFSYSFEYLNLSHLNNRQ